MYGREQRDLWGIEYSCKEHRKDMEGSAGLSSRGVGYKVVMARGKEYNRR